MPKSKAEDLDKGPYPQRQIVERIEVRAASLGRTEGKQIAGLVNAAPNWWTRRRTGAVPLTLPEISRLAAEMGAEQGFPFLDQHHQKALARGLAELAKEAAADPQRASPATARAERRATKARR